MTVIKEYNTSTGQWETIVVGKQGPQGIQGVQGPSGVVSVTAPITNSGTSTSAALALSTGNGLSTSGGTLAADFGTTSTKVASGDRGLPTGGTTGQVLAKASSTDYDDVWANARLAGSAGRALNTGGAFFDGSTGLVLSGIAGNLASSPDSVAVSVTGDIDIKAKVTINDWQNSLQSVVSRYSGTTQRSFSLGLRGFGDLSFVWSTDGTVGTQTAVISNKYTISNGATKWIRFTMDVNNGAGSRVTKFYLSDDGTTWTDLGAGPTAGTTSIFDGTSILEIGNAGLGSPVAGTIHRVIIQSAFDTNDNTSNVVFDANFETVPANALAFTESSANAATVSLVTTRYQYGLPNVQWSTSNATQALTANRVYYQPFLVTEPIIIDATTFRVTAGPASAANVRCGIYASDSNYQPTGAPVLDSGNVAVATSATGNFITTVTPVTLQPGLYLSAINTSVALTMQVARGGLAGADITNGTSAIYLLMLGTQTQGAFPNPGTAWTSRTLSTTGANHMLFYRWSPA